MLLPSKHIRLSESLFGLAGYLLRLLDTPVTVDELWWKFSKVNNSRHLPAFHDLDNVILALNFLYTIGAININDQGLLIK